MKWLRNWFDNQVKASWIRVNREEKADFKLPIPITLNNGSALKSASQRLERDPTLNFRLHKAENGWVIEMYGYDDRTERSYSRLNLILDTEDFDKQLAQIVTMEALRS
jgi:hypothetical protein